MPAKPVDRAEAFRVLNGLSEDNKEELGLRSLKTPLIKTFLLEHVSSANGIPAIPADSIFSRMGCWTYPIDETLLSITIEEKSGENNAMESKTVGFLETYDERFFAYYTVEKSADAQKRVYNWQQRSRFLDATWFSSPLLQYLWDCDVSQRGDKRFSKIVFKHESIFEMPEIAEDTVAVEEDNLTESYDEIPTEDEDSLAPERRKARFEMSDRIERIRDALSSLQDHYSPLHALFSLRIPSIGAQGSHDLYQHGQITCRSDSFENHRNTVRYLYRIYKSILDNTEEAAWRSGSRSESHSIGDTVGVPLIIRFREKLNTETFHRWMQLAFHKRNRFRLWGNPLWLGPTKVHLYGADRHLWQPINLEFTEGGVVAVLPQGTCGNTFHRLLTNIQHYVSPDIDAWVGSRSIRELLPENTSS